ncbi:MAG TPA: hypothetical protein DIC51_02060 [Coxiellaceae bacterium]|nr:hypothetical protein [Coxiellaceae bacterium]
MPTDVADVREFIENRIKKVPGNPSATLFSRRKYEREGYPVRGDVIAFNLTDAPVILKGSNDDLRDIIRRVQNCIKGCIDEELILKKIVKVDSDGQLKWSEKKEERRKQKPYKDQKTFHVSIASSLPPSTKADSSKVKAAQESILIDPSYLQEDLNAPSCSAEQVKFIKKDDKSRAVGQALQQYIETKPQATISECKLNPDGHIVIRVRIEPKEKLLGLKAELGTLLSGTYKRYDDPEKETTLAAVIFVVNCQALSEGTGAKIRTVVKTLDEQLRGRTFDLEHLFWVDYACRTLSPHSIKSRKDFHCSSKPVSAAEPTMDERAGISHKMR